MTDYVVMEHILSVSIQHISFVDSCCTLFLDCAVTDDVVMEHIN